MDQEKKEVKEIFINGNVASSKNGKVWTGKYFVNSKQTQAYMKESKADFVKYKDDFLKMLEGKTKPYKLSLRFVRKSKHQFDYINPCQSIHDIMVKEGWLDDDNADEIIPVFEPYEYDKENPGVYIKIL